ncbi:ferritin-like domain-containing protein [Marivita sp.]|uniref:ferritin-like domain-containing protein n=1 Tax=Marivita sp. TaxID=2003365 RepID=UPI0025C4E34F|nr:ferritin-like domain-containing protein [Marivita sp.]
MTTTVGTENQMNDLLGNLLKLEHDAIAAYEATIERLDDAESKAQIESFRQDHNKHVAELESHAAKHGVDVPKEGDMKQYLTTGKVALAELAGDQTILKAMKTNEDDTVQAYEQALSNSLSEGELRATFEKALADEKRHRSWMESKAA